MVDFWTGRYAATDEEHDEAAWGAIPEDRRVSARGIEVGHIFYFGTKYSASMDLKLPGPDGAPVAPEMGSYGIGVSRLVGALIEANHDEAGIRWPDPVAPFAAAVLNLKQGDAACDALCERLHAALGPDCLYDDRAERAGVKFADADLMGHPWQCIVGPRGAAAGRVELKRRATGERQEVSPEDAVARGPGDRGGLMFGAFERLVALRYLAARKGERFVSFNAWFSLIGIALGVATLIIVMSVMNGFRQELLGRILGLNGHLGAYAAEGGPLRDFDAVAARIRAVPGIVEATPIIEGQVLITSESGGASGGLARGIRPGRPPRARHHRAQHPPRQPRRVRGRGHGGRSAPASPTACASGVGDRITLVSPQGRATVVGTLPRLRAFRIAAIFNVGMNEYDSTFAFLPLAAAQAYFQMPEAATQIEVFVEDPTRVRAATREIWRALADRPVRLLDWQESNNSFFAAVQVERNVMFLILTLIILVAAFNIVTTQTMLVKDKRRDIAILRTVGARRGAVLRVFLMCGAAIGVLGTTAGLLLGLVFCAYIEEIRQFLQWLTSTQLFPAGGLFPRPAPGGGGRVGGGAGGRP